MHFEPRFRTLVDIFEHAVASVPGPRALRHEEGRDRWRGRRTREFGSLVERFRGGLASLGVKRGDAVAIVANNRVEWAVAAYACYGLGAAFVPMYEAQHPKEWEFIVRDCEAKVLIVASEAAAREGQGHARQRPSLRHIVLLDGTANGDGRDHDVRGAPVDPGTTLDSIKPAPEDTAGLIYTSGTTGNPKGVILTHLEHRVRTSARCTRSFPIGAGGPLAVVSALGALVRADGRAPHACSRSARRWPSARASTRSSTNLAEVRPTLLFSVPRIFNKIYTAVQQQIASKPTPVQELVQDGAQDHGQGARGRAPASCASSRSSRPSTSSSSRRCAHASAGGSSTRSRGGAALSRDVAEFIDSLGITVYEGYGLTETSPIATANSPGARKIGSVGRAIPGVRVEIDPATGERKPAENGKPARLEGEIVVYGHNVMKGYFKRPEENAAVFTKDGGFRTGDMGYIDPHGFLFITGRIKEQYKLENGKYVVPTPLEEQLKLSPYVANAMVYGDNQPFNVALVVANVPAVQHVGRASTQRAAGRRRGACSRTSACVRSSRTRSRSTAAAFKGFESIQDFALIADDFTTENGMLTPSLKLKRRKVDRDVRRS